MAPARVTFAPLPPSDSGKPPASSELIHDGDDLSDYSDQTPAESSEVKIDKFIQVWGTLEHPNVLGLLGYILNHKDKIDLLISPQLINGNIRDFLSAAPVGVAERLGFVRDVTAGLDHLHSQNPSIYHRNLDPRNVLIDENFNAVLTNWGLSEIADSAPSRYESPEDFLREGENTMEANDMWSWASVAFEASIARIKILTDKRPFSQHEVEKQIYSSIVNRKAPGQPDLILDLVPDAPKPEDGSALRSLHYYLPLCWDYEPKKRPRASIIRQQVFMFSFEADAGDSVVATLEELAYLLIPSERLRHIGLRTLGEGYYGEVVQGILDESSSTPREVAVKRLKAVGTRGERVRLAKRLARELNIWAKIKHPNIVELIGYYLDEKYESPLLISAFMPHGNVLDFIKSHNPNMERRIAFVKDITAGLACLHNFNPAICHADLKPAGFTVTKGKGTPRYMSPELLRDNDPKHNLESDVWAWACTVFEILTGLIPYAEAAGDADFWGAIFQRKPPGDITLLPPVNMEGVHLEAALTRCWDFNPELRPSIGKFSSRISNVSPQIVNEHGGATEGSVKAPDLLTKLEPGLTTGSGKWVKFVTVVPGQHGRFRIDSGMPPIYGGFSDVWRCDARFSDGRVIAAAVKKFRAVRIARGADASTVTDRLLKRLTKELDIWMALQHPQISPLLGFVLEDDLCIISPWYTNGNVAEYIVRHPEVDRIKLVSGLMMEERHTMCELLKRSVWDQLWNWKKVSDVAFGLAYLHSRVPLVVHGDMKPDNVLIDGAGNAVIIDFGLSTIVEDDPTLATSLAGISSSLQGAGNPRWMAPELSMEECCTRSPSTDVYSFGCVALQIYTGEIPFKDVPTFRIIYALIQGQKPLAKREDYPNTDLSSPSLDWFYDLLVSCWDGNPTARPSMVDVESKLRMGVSSGASGTT
ncbi:hypothetical protein FRC04_009099 [Tulasnella sp. 424]|nr:hypothetical protein FRC04_009099 [Tulasnella sp. 424]